MVQRLKFVCEPDRVSVQPQECLAWHTQGHAVQCPTVGSTAKRGAMAAAAAGICILAGNNCYLL